MVTMIVGICGNCDCDVVVLCEGSGSGSGSVVATCSNAECGRVSCCYGRRGRKLLMEDPPEPTIEHRDEVISKADKVSRGVAVQCCGGVAWRVVMLVYSKGTVVHSYTSYESLQQRWRKA